MKTRPLAVAALPAAGVVARYARCAITILQGLGRPLRTRLRLMLWGLYHPRYYPCDVRLLAYAVAGEAPLLPASPLAICWPFIAVPNGSDDRQSLQVLRLAGAYVDIDALPGFWRESAAHRDPEQISASHRFHWAIEWQAAGLTTAAAAQIATTIAVWLETFSTPSSGDAWQPYTVSERICNWLVLLPALCYHGALSGSLRTRMLEAFAIHVAYLAAHLEYPAGGLVNNHILNNARALYLAGALLGLPASQRLGRALFERHLPTMVTDVGYLNEASSHYQLLLTRSVLECAAVARHLDDEPFGTRLNRVATKMLGACGRLFPSELTTPEEGPRIGDVSPDIPFDWLSPHHGLWPTTPDYSLSTHCVSGIQDGWLLLDTKDWAMRAFVHPARDTYPTGHGHADFGSFWLAWQGKAIVVDRGRLTYAPVDGALLSGAEPSSHGVVLANGFPLLPGGRGLRGKLAGESMYGTRCELIDGGQGARWTVLDRSGIYWQRTVAFGDGQVVITDHIADAGRAMVESSFYLAPSLSVDDVSPSEWRVYGDGVNITVDCGPRHDWSCLSAPFYPEYGVALNAPCLRWRRLGAEQIQIRMVLTPGVVS
jgi:hypothetical protein